LAEVNAELRGKSILEKNNVPFLKAMVVEEKLLTAQIEVQTDIISANTEEFNRRAEAIRDGTAATEEAGEAEEVITEERQKELDAIEAVIAGLELEVKVLEEGDFARVAATLAAKNAGVEAVIRAAHIFGLIEALREQARAEQELEKSLAATNREAERERERLEKKRDKAVKDAAAAARKLAEDTRLAVISNQIREVTEESKEMAETMGQAFSDIVDGTKSVGDAFASMVTDILKQLQRLIIQKTIVEPILGFLISNFAPGASGGGGSPVDLPAGFQTQEKNPFFSEGTFDTSVARSVRGQNVVQQTIIFSPSLIDGASGARFIQQNAGVITEIVADGARNSGQLTSAFSGQNQ